MIQEQMALDTVERGDQRIMENTAAEVLQHEELSTTDRTMRALEYERSKSKFFASLSQDILFECSWNPALLTLYGRGEARLGLERDTVDPVHNEKVLEVVGDSQLRELIALLKQTTPENPEVNYPCIVRLDGRPVPVHILCQAVWSLENEEEPAGVIGKIIEDEEEQH